MPIDRLLSLRLFTNTRRLWILCTVFLGLSYMSIGQHRSTDIIIEVQTILSIQVKEKIPFQSGSSLDFEHVKKLLETLFDSRTSLNNIQSSWNQLMNVWRQILEKLLQDACQLCHQNDTSCHDSIDISRYIYYINETFYPYNETKRPAGMGLYHYFDLKNVRSVNNKILPTDVSFCDYFHMMQLMINVQTILHQAQIKYFLTKGTLIGTLRHHDVIPWDTDIDLFIPASATPKILRSFRRLETTQKNFEGLKKDRDSFQKDIAVYPFRNVYKVTSYKIFSLRSPLIRGTNYRWPKIDIFPYEENATHIYAYPKHRHNLGTMNYLAKSNVDPVYLRILGPLLVPSPRQPRLSLKSMIKSGRENVFQICVGNTFLQRYNRGARNVKRLPCEKLHETYPFVRAKRNSTSGICFEELKYPQLNQSLSLFMYRCAEDLPRTLS